MSDDQTEAQIVDPWSPLDYKDLNDRAEVLPPWMSKRDRRRVMAYIMLAAYAENASAAFGATNERREYGDPALIIEQVLSHLLGETQRIEVDGADVQEDAPEEGAPRGRHAAPRRVSPQAYAQQWLDDWADKENFLMRLVDAERKAVALGDAVYVIDIDTVKGRPRLGVFDPGLYFPVLPDDLAADDYPTKVHFAWEEEREANNGETEKWLRRITYELTEDVTYDIGQDGSLIEIPTPWRPDYADEDTTLRCFLTDVSFRQDDSRGATRLGFMALDRLDISNAVPRMSDDGDPMIRVPLDIDFLPIVHVSNTIPGSQHFGQSVLSKVLQVLDDLQAADSDTQKAQATTGWPMIALSAVKAPDNLRIGPGEFINLGADGTATVIDTSAALRAMAEQVSELRERANQNARIPDAALGRVRNATESGMSGIALTIRYGPLAAQIRQARLARDAKYRLLFRFIQRIGIVLGDGPRGGVQDARLALGTYMPQDTSAALTSAATAYVGGVVSLETAVRMCQAGGAPIEDLAEEIRLIQTRDFTRAGALGEATGDVAAVREFLGLAPMATEAQSAPPGTGTPVGVPGAPGSGTGAGASGTETVQIEI